jgi:hypothetical protein
MRTTLSIDDDVLAAVRERARREKRTAGEVASDLIRDSLTQIASTRATRNGFPVIPSRGGVVTNELVRSIRDEIGE